MNLAINAESPCLFTQGIEGELPLPVAHAEGKLFWADEAVGERLERENLAVFRYAVPPGEAESFPHNPNGSLAHIAGVCDPSGQILGLMPHPERYQFPWQHPLWTRENGNGHCGLAIFENAIKALKSGRSESTL